MDIHEQIINVAETIYVLKHNEEDCFELAKAKIDRSVSEAAYLVTQAHNLGR